MKKYNQLKLSDFVMAVIMSSVIGNQLNSDISFHICHY